MRKTVTILLPVLFLLILLLGALLGVYHLVLHPDEAVPAAEYYRSEAGRGLVLSTGAEGSFPSRTGLKTGEMKDELDAILDQTQTMGFQALYVEVTDGSTAFYRSSVLPCDSTWAGERKPLLFDPLSYLCRGAAKRGIELYALTELSDLQGEEVFTELGRYDLAGVVALGAQRLEDPRAFCRSAAAALKNRSPEAAFGLVFGAQELAVEEVTELSAEGLLDVVHIHIGADLDADRPSYGDLLDEWADGLENTGTGLVLYQPLYGIEDAPLREELGCRLMTATMDERVGGCLFDGYSVLQTAPREAEAVISHFAPGGARPDLLLEFEQELHIYGPDTDEVRLDNSYTSYFVSGTSDPDLPLTLNGEEVKRISSNGVWGVLVELTEGTNTFTFAQEDRTDEITFEVYDPADATPNPIDRITAGSLFPTCDRVFQAEEEMTFTCVAPSGAAVTAKIGSKTVTMTQKAATALPDIAATFEGTFTLPATAHDEVVSLGQVTYILDHKGSQSEYTSAGQLFAAGKDANIMGQVDDYMMALYTDSTGSADVAANLNPGTRLCLRGEHQNGREQLRDSDLFAPMASFTVLTGKQESRITYKDVTLRTAAKGEELVLGEGLNVCLPELENGLLTMTLLDTAVEGADQGLTLLEYDTEAMDEGKTQPPSSLFRRIAVQNNKDGSATFTMELLPGVSLSGWDACLDAQGQAVLYFQKMAPLSQTYSRPLEGITVMVDPGHGGSDPGALGAAGAGGPNEAQVNLALSHALRYRLEQLGATVTMTQSDNSRITIYDRYLLAQQQRPDLFISVHHNSLALTRDANEIYYTIGYYHYPQSEFFAKTAAQEVSRRVGRDLIESVQADYYVTRMSAAPSILFETGFVSNPREQQECCDPILICKTACALADSIVQTFEQPWLQPLA